MVTKMVGLRNDLTPEAVEQIREKLCKFDKFDRQKIKHMYLDRHMSATAIGKSYDVGCQTIQTALRMEGIKIRNMKNAQYIYLKHNNSRSKRQSEFMKNNNPMDNPEYRKKVSQPGKKNPMWNGGKQIICERCGKSRYLKPSRYKKLMLNGLCWNCYKHSNPKSSIEKLMAKELSKIGIIFEEQVPYHGMFLDFYLPEFNIVIECDGEYWHSLPDNKKRDKKKEALLSQEGYNLLRFSEKEIKDNVTFCVSEVIKNGKSK